MRGVANGRAAVAVGATVDVQPGDSIMTVLPADGTGFLRMPSAAGEPGRMIVLSNASLTNAISITGLATETFAGQAYPVELATEATYVIQSDGFNWVGIGTG